MGEWRPAVKTCDDLRGINLAGKADLPYFCGGRSDLMVRLKVTAENQITLDQAILEHLGIGPGDEIEVTLQPGGFAIVDAGAKERQVEPDNRKLPIEAIFGMLENTTGKRYTIDELNEAIEEGWAGKR